MGNEKKRGLDCKLFVGKKGTLIDTLIALAPNKWHKIVNVADPTALPTGLKATHMFETPDTTSTAITLLADDSVFPLTLQELCKADLTIDNDQGVIETSDDCDGGNVSKLLDGFVDRKGTIGGFMRYDEITKKVYEVTEEFINRFYDVVGDDGEAGYTYTERNDEELLLMVCLNKDAAIGEYQNWVLIPAILPSFSLNVALKDAHKRDLSWEQGQGLPSFYQRKVFAADVIS